MARFVIHRRAAVVAVTGIALQLTAGLTGGAAALGLASRRLTEPVVDA